MHKGTTSEHVEPEHEGAVHRGEAFRLCFEREEEWRDEREKKERQKICCRLSPPRTVSALAMWRVWRTDITNRQGPSLVVRLWIFVESRETGEVSAVRSSMPVQMRSVTPLRWLTRDSSNGV